MRRGSTTMSQRFKRMMWPNSDSSRNLTVMSTVFWDQKGVILTEFTSNSPIISPNIYMDTLTKEEKEQSAI